MKTCLLTGTIAIFACFSMIGLAQEGSKPAAAAQAQKSDSKPEAKKGRLPANYGKLGLTDSQKTKIYEVQGQYEGQLAALEKQLEMVKSKRDAEVAAVLSADQRKILENLVVAARDAKAKAKQEATPPTEGAKATAAPAAKK